MIFHLAIIAQLFVPVNHTFSLFLKISLTSPCYLFYTFLNLMFLSSVKPYFKLHIFPVELMSGCPTSLILAPFMLIGLFGGIFAGNILNEKRIKRLVILLLIISGFALIF